MSELPESSPGDAPAAAAIVSGGRPDPAGPAAPPSGPDPTAWRGLPARGAAIAATGSALSLALPLAIAAFVGATLADLGSPLLLALAGGVLGALPGAWLGASRHRRTRWKIDAHGFALLRGRLWQTDSRVPISRVQHLDVKHGPLERALSLATLVIHTAGTRMATVSVAMLDRQDAEQLRDLLARQLDHDDDAL